MRAVASTWLPSVLSPATVSWSLIDFSQFKNRCINSVLATPGISTLSSNRVSNLVFFCVLFCRYTRYDVLLDRGSTNVSGRGARNDVDVLAAGQLADPGPEPLPLLGVLGLLVLPGTGSPRRRG